MRWYTICMRLWFACDAWRYTNLFWLIDWLIDWLSDSCNCFHALLLVTKSIDCAQRTQTSSKVSNLYQMWSEIQIQISGLIRIRIRMSAGLLPKCESIPCRLQSCRRVSWKSGGDCMRNANKSPKIRCSAIVSGSGKVIWNPRLEPDHHQQLM